MPLSLRSLWLINFGPFSQWHLPPCHHSVTSFDKVLCTHEVEQTFLLLSFTFSLSCSPPPRFPFISFTVDGSRLPFSLVPSPEYFEIKENLRTNSRPYLNLVTLAALLSHCLAGDRSSTPLLPGEVGNPGSH